MAILRVVLSGATEEKSWGGRKSPANHTYEEKEDDELSGKWTLAALQQKVSTLDSMAARALTNKVLSAQASPAYGSSHFGITVSLHLQSVSTFSKCVTNNVRRTCGTVCPPPGTVSRDYLHTEP